MKQFHFFLILILFWGCGYKPNAKYTKKILGSKLSINVDIYTKEPEISIIIKDALIQVLMNRFKIKIVQKEYSINHLDIKISDISESAIEYNINGFIIAKRISVTLNVTKQIKDKRRNYSVTGTFDLSIEPNAFISDASRFKAIKIASFKAIYALITELVLPETRTKQSNFSKVNKN